MGLVQVIIDDSTDKVISGVFVFDRDSGGVIKIPHGTAFPVSPLADELFWRDDESKLYKRNGTNTTWVAVVAAVAAHASTHQHGGADEVATATPGVNAIPKADGGGKLDSWVTANAVAGTPSLRQLGTGTTDACAGDDSRLSNARTPTSHASTHQHGGSDEVATATPAANAVPKADGSSKLDSWVTANAVAGTPSLRQLGTGATDACAGNDSRLSNARTPTAHAASHQHGGSDEVATATPAANSIPKADASAKVDGWVSANAAASVASLRKLGTGNTDACAGNDSRLSDARTPVTHASSHEVGGTDVIAHQNLSGAGTNSHSALDTHLGSTSNPHSTTASQVGLGNVTNDSQLKRAANDFSTFTEKATPVSADLLLIEDSAAAGVKKKVQVGNLPGGSGTDVNAIHKNVAAEISTISEKTALVGADLLVLEDSEASNAKKRSTIANLLKVCGRCNIGKVNFFDDFIGSLYNNRAWAVAGTGSFTDIDETGGVMRVRASSGATYTLDQGNNGAWSPAKGVSITWRGYCVPGASGLVEVGMMSSTNETTDWIGWRYAPTENANFLCESAVGGVATTVNSGVAGDGNYHDFRIDITTGNVKFYLDGTLRATITTNVTTDRLQPYVYNQGVGAVSDFNTDWVEVVGAR
jgi:hypothetical protein